MGNYNILCNGDNPGFNVLSWNTNSAPLMVDNPSLENGTTWGITENNDGTYTLCPPVDSGGTGTYLGWSIEGNLLSFPNPVSPFTSWSLSISATTSTTITSPDGTWLLNGNTQSPYTVGLMGAASPPSGTNWTIPLT